MQVKTKSVISLVGIAMILASPLSAAPMSKSQIETHLIGKDLTTKRRGISIKLVFNHDHSVKMKALFISGSGKWAFNGDELCMDMESGPKKGETCMTFEDLGDGKFSNSAGMILTVN